MLILGLLISPCCNLFVASSALSLVINNPSFSIELHDPFGSWVLDVQLLASLSDTFALLEDHVDKHLLLLTLVKAYLESYVASFLMEGHLSFWMKINYNTS